MNDERAAQGIDHLQAAAREMIAAARAFLDVVEELIEDRDQVASVVHAVGSAARGAARAVRDANPMDPHAGGGDTADGGVQHIRVS
ncbi:hypothetical protein [Rhabdothermincola sp.]|uniref:hypothetical protein n=1 Tax=Rhabdothermincola sp. TaxID=2820405 RepID=UPI002FE14058